MQKYAEEPSAYKYTSDDLQALKPFIAHLRNSLILAQEESDARTPEGAVTYPLSTEFVRTKIKTDPTLRYLWRRLTPAQKAYAENRYIQNTPTRYETMPAMTPNPFAAPLEHDYQLTHNPAQYRTGRAIQSGALGVTQGGLRSVVGSTIVKPLSRVSDGVVERLPGMIRTSGEAGADVSDDALTALKAGGYSQQTNLNALRQQPLGTLQRTTEAASRIVAPTALDVYTFSTALPNSLSTAGVASSKGLNAAIKTSKAIGTFLNPVNAVIHPKQWFKSALDSKFLGIMPAIDLVTDISTLRDTVKESISGDVAEALSAQSAELVDALRFGGSKDPRIRAEIQRRKERKMQSDLNTYSTGTKPGTRSNNNVNTDSKSSSKDSISGFWDRYKIPAAGALVGGGLGAALDQRSRLRGFLVGSLLGAAAPALYDYVKKRYS